MQVETVCGTLQGERRAGHFAFRGIPFALPPVGPLRFCAPQAPEPWQGVRPALAFGPAAIQGTSEIMGMGTGESQSEDCLYLNVYTPATDDAHRPVMFWIHGGAFTLGSGASPLYDGGPLCEYGDVVVVTINYRLGALGYLSLLDHGGAEWGATANAGQLDQIAALRWVRDNIARFGGDPDNVTIFGESAGSFACNILLAMPAARGLFHKAICQSGASMHMGEREEARKSAKRFLAQLGLGEHEAERLRELPAQAILDAQKATPQAVGLRTFFPIADGETLPVNVGDALEAGASADIPLVIGSNRDEMNLFNAPFLREIDKPMPDATLLDLLQRRTPPELAEHLPRLVEAYRTARTARGLPAGNRHLIGALQTDLIFRIPSVRVAEAKSAHPQKAFMYLFTQESPGMRGALASCHAMEIAFVFGTLHAPFQDRFAGKGPEVEALSRRMMDAWLTFARTGNPSHPGVGDWVPYDSQRRATMIFGPNGGLHNAPFDDERAAWDGVI